MIWEITAFNGTVGASGTQLILTEAILQFKVQTGLSEVDITVFWMCAEMTGTLSSHGRASLGCSLSNWFTDFLFKLVAFGSAPKASFSVTIDDSS